MASSQQTRAAQLLNDVHGFSVDPMEPKKDNKFWAYDQLAMAIVVDPEIVVEAKEAYAVVELHGQLTRAQLVVDWSNKLGKTPNVRIVSRVDQTRYEKVTLTGYTAV